MAPVYTARVSPCDWGNHPSPAHRQLRQHQHAADADTAVSIHVEAQLSACMGVLLGSVKTIAFSRYWFGLCIIGGHHTKIS